MDLESSYKPNIQIGKLHLAKKSTNSTIKSPLLSAYYSPKPLKLHSRSDKKPIRKDHASEKTLKLGDNDVYLNELKTKLLEVVEENHRYRKLLSKPKPQIWNEIQAFQSKLAAKLKNL
jgi:hypothetical protein